MTMRPSSAVTAASRSWLACTSLRTSASCPLTSRRYSCWRCASRSCTSAAALRARRMLVCRSVVGRHQFGLLLFELQRLVARGKTLGSKFTHIAQLATLDLGLLAPADEHLLQPRSLALEACNRLLSGRHLGAQRRLARRHQLALHGHQLLRHGVVGTLQVGMELDRRLAQSPRPADGFPAHAGPGSSGESSRSWRARCRLPAHQRFTAFDALPLTHDHILDDAALQMLDGLAPHLDRHRGRRDHALVQRRPGGPGQKQAEAHDEHPETQPGG
jgi:hypothetical protein